MAYDAEVNDSRPDAKDLFRRYEEAKSLRSPYEADWRMASAYCLPRHYSAWNLQGPPSLSPNTAAAKRFAYDSTGARAVPKFAAILQRLATPDGHKWHKLEASDPGLMKSYNVRAYFDTLTFLLFKMRYNPLSLFQQSIGEVYIGLGVYGTAPLRLSWRMPSWESGVGGFAYKALPLKDTFVLYDADGRLFTVFIRLFMTARQFQVKFPGIQPPKAIAAELGKPNPSDTHFFELVHVCHPRLDYKPDAISVKRHPITSSYLIVDGQEYVGPEQGYRSWPYLIPRTATEPGDTYGFSPAMQAMPALGGVNAMKKTILKQGQKAVDPPLLAHDDGVLSGKMGLTPGFVNYGGVNAAGQRLVYPLETGDFNVAEKLLEGEREDINDAFMVTLFQILMETPEMTATEVVERVAEKAALIAPTMGRLQSGLLGPEIDREIKLIVENAPELMPAMPQELVEANGEYEILYTSPLAKGLHAEEDAGFMRLLEIAINTSTALADPSHLDHFNMDVAIPELADHMSVPTRWIRSPEEIAQVRATRAQAQQQQQLVDAAPSIASVAATASKAGQLPPGNMTAGPRPTGMPVQ